MAVACVTGKVPSQGRGQMTSGWAGGTVFESRR